MADVSVGFWGKGSSDGPFYLTNSQGWVRVIEWVDSLATKAFPALRGLAQLGSCEGTDRLAAELAAVASAAPEEAGVRAALGALADKLGVGSPDETAVIVE